MRIANVLEVWHHCWWLHPHFTNSKFIEPKSTPNSKYSQTNRNGWKTWSVISQPLPSFRYRFSVLYQKSLIWWSECHCTFDEPCVSGWSILSPGDMLIWSVLIQGCSNVYVDVKMFQCSPRHYDVLAQGFPFFLKRKKSAFCLVCSD